MKRSEINAIIKEFEAMLKEYKFALPPFLSFTPEEWAEKNHEYDEIRDNALGWDVTDYGMGNYDKLGLADLLRTRGSVLKEEFRPDGAYYEATVKIDELHKFTPYLL